MSGRNFDLTEDSSVRKSHYTKEQISFASKQAELGTPVAEVCRKMGFSEANFFWWKQKFHHIGVVLLTIVGILQFRLGRSLRPAPANSGLAAMRLSR